MSTRIQKSSHRAALCAGVAMLAVASEASGQSSQATSEVLEPVTVIGNYNNAVGTSDAASQGSVTARLIESRPTLRPAEVLEFVPGVIVSQHSGDGKANQYYLRGFNLDHGTDFATFVDGMPANMRTHAHGHGYTDLNWLIPELVDRIDYKKGPYYAEEGDFSAAGAARIRLFDRLPSGIGSLTAGSNHFERALVANSSPLAGGDLLYAVEAGHNNGPWLVPERFHRLNGVLRFSFGDATQRSSLTAMAYSAGWRATDQIPQRAVDSALVDRYGSLDPTDGGRTARYSLSFATERSMGNGTFRFGAYAIKSRLGLFSNFTYNLDQTEPLNADQFEQAEQRRVFGLAGSRSFNHRFAGRESTTTVGVEARHDRLDPVGLYRALAGQRVATTQESQVRETSGAFFVDNATRWWPWLRSVAGLRYDRFRFAVQSSVAENSGTQSAGIASPKLSLILGPWHKTEVFVNAGHGYHSNDARGVLAHVAPIEWVPTAPTTALVRAKGAEIGLRTEPLPGLQSSLALWQLRLASELVFSGDAGDTEASGASRRYGIEFNNHYVVRPWLQFDADLALSRARFERAQGDAPHEGRDIPGAVQTVASFGATVTDLGRWSGQLQVRYFGPRPLIEDNSRRSRGTTLAYLRVGHRVSPKISVALDVFNLLDRRASDIDYYYRSRLPGEQAEGVADIHFHPAERRTIRLTVGVRF